MYVLVSPNKEMMFRSKDALIARAATELDERLEEGPASPALEEWLDGCAAGRVDTQAGEWGLERLSENEFELQVLGEADTIPFPE